MYTATMSTKHCIHNEGGYRDGEKKKKLRRSREIL